MRTTGIILLLMWASQILWAQSVVVDRQVVGSTGALYEGSAYIDASVGESVIITGGNSNIIVTQGFEQPLFKNLLIVSLDVVPESCRGAADGGAVILEIAGCNPPYNVLWSNGGNGMAAGGFETGEHSVSVVTDACQTEITFFIDLESDEECRLHFYSGITPNDDGNNDYWHIENITHPRFANNEVHIFNRWGSEVWSGKNYDNQSVRWEGEGRKQGKLPDGTYYYIAEINGMTYKGFIELTR
jgi:gliding motility-associated-like protein